MKVRKTPVQRAVKAVLEIERVGELVGTFHALDFGTDSLEAEGIFEGAAGVYVRLKGELPRFVFSIVERGRPAGKTEAVDVAVALCSYWHRRTKAPNRANGSGPQVLAWWDAQRTKYPKQVWPVFNDVAQLNRQIKRGGKAIAGCSLMYFEPENMDDPATLIATPPGSYSFERLGAGRIRVTVDGKGWIWQSARHRADRGHFRFAFTTTDARAPRPAITD